MATQANGFCLFLLLRRFGSMFFASYRPPSLFVRLPLGGWATRVFCVKPPPGPQSPAPFAFCVVSDLRPRFTPPPGAGGWAGSARSTWRPASPGACPACLCGSDAPGSTVASGWRRSQRRLLPHAADLLAAETPQNVSHSAPSAEVRTD